MANIIDMPKLSDTMTVGTLVKWLKKEGDTVKNGDMLAEVETDKATMELECFFDGTILKIFSAAGSQVAIGDPLCAIGKPGEKVDAPEGKGGASAPPAKKEKNPETEASAETESWEDEDDGEDEKDAEQATDDKAGEGAAKEPRKEGAATTAKNEVAPRPAAKPASVSAPKPTEEPPPAEGAAETNSRPAGERLRISPLARKLAAEKKIDPAQVKGSGPHGRIVRADVLAAEKSGGTSKAAAGGSRAAPGKNGAVGAASPAKVGPIQEEKVVAVSNIRGIIAKRLLESKLQIPHFYLDIEVDVGPLLEMRAQLNNAFEKDGVKLSVNDFVLKGSAEALRRVPAVNASWEGNQIRYFGAAHVSFAVAIEDGLITPVVRDAHEKTVFQISAEAKQLGAAAKAKKLQPAQFTGGTFCVSNLGMMGITKFSAIINPPNGAILAVGTTVKKPVVKNDQIVIGQTMMLTLSCDHRVVDGAVGATYLAALKDLLEKPALLLV